MDEKKITWVLSPEQAEQIAAMLDLACKAGGINVAKAAVPLMDSLMVSVAAMKESKED